MRRCQCKYCGGISHEYQPTAAHFHPLFCTVIPPLPLVIPRVACQVSKERFAAMLSDMRERGTPDEKLKELITKENYDRYLKIAAPMSAMQV